MPATYTYPDMIGSKGNPFVMFNRHKPVYDEEAAANITDSLSTIALYIPINFNLSDSIQYETAQTGVLGGLIANAMDSNKSIDQMFPEDFSLNDPDIAALTKSSAPFVAGAAAGAIAKAFGSSTMAAALTGGGTGGVAAAASSEAARKLQATVNPRQFALFKAPNQRNFSFDFRFVPNSAKESDAAVNIIKEFRTAMYPVLSSTGYSYTFPDAFTITFENVDGMPKLPEVVCTGATVTYNPNAMSYFTQNKRPVEINLGLQFQELQPIHRAMVEKGY